MSSRHTYRASTHQHINQYTHIDIFIYNYHTHTHTHLHHILPAPWTSLPSWAPPCRGDVIGRMPTRKMESFNGFLKGQLMDFKGFFKWIFSGFLSFFKWMFDGFHLIWSYLEGFSLIHLLVPEWFWFIFNGLLNGLSSRWISIQPRHSFESHNWPNMGIV